jgi:hypothetical protein
MRKAQAAGLQAKWKQLGDTLPPCMHPIQEVAPSNEGYVTTTYHSLVCGEAIERPYEHYAT